MSQSPEIPFSSRNRTLAILVILAIGLFLRTFQLDHFGIWYDEKISLISARGMVENELPDGGFHPGDLDKSAHFSSIKEATIRNTGGNSLIYHLALSAWIRAFGTADWVIRLLSVFFGMLSLWLSYRLALRITGSGVAALVTLAIVAIHPLAIEFAREAKSYSMALFFILCASLVLFRAPRYSMDFRQGSLYALFALLALLCHYFVAYVLLFHLLMLAWPSADTARRMLRAIAPAVLISGGMLAWYFSGGSDGLHHMAERNLRYEMRALHYAEGHDPFYTPATPVNIIKGWFQAVMPAHGSQLQKMGVRIRYTWAFLLIPLFIYGAAFYKARTRNMGRAPFQMLLILPVYLALMSLLALSSGHCISFQPLYGLFSVPFVALAMGYGLFVLWKSQWELPAILSGLLLAVFMGFTSLSSVNEVSFVKEPRTRNAVKTLYHQIAREHGPDGVVFRETLDAQLFSVYATDSPILIQRDGQLESPALLFFPDSEPIPVFYEIR